MIIDDDESYYDVQTQRDTIISQRNLNNNLKTLCMIMIIMCPPCEWFDSTNKNYINTTNTSTASYALTPALHESYGANETM